MEVPTRRKVKPCKYREWSSLCFFPHQLDVGIRSFPDHHSPEEEFRLCTSVWRWSGLLIPVSTQSSCRQKRGERAHGKSLDSQSPGALRKGTYFGRAASLFHG